MSEPSAESTSAYDRLRHPGLAEASPGSPGHRIRVQDIVTLKERMGMTIDEIVSSYPTMTPEEIAAAMSYYQAHREEIDRDLKEEEELADQIENGPNIVTIRLTGLVDAGSHPNPSG